MSDIQKEHIYFSYDPNDTSIENVSLSFDVEPGIHCAQLLRMCKRFALALGYAEATVEKYFGPDREDDWL